MAAACGSMLYTGNTVRISLCIETVALVGPFTLMRHPIEEMPPTVTLHNVIPAMPTTVVMPVPASLLTLLVSLILLHKSMDQIDAHGAIAAFSTLSFFFAAMFSILGCAEETIQAKITAPTVICMYVGLLAIIAPCFSSTIVFIATAVIAPFIVPIISILC